MPSSKLKKSIVSVPVLGYLILLIKNSLRLPAIYDQLLQDQRRTDSLFAELQKTQQKAQEEAQETIALSDKRNLEQNLELSKSIGALQIIQDDLRGSFSLLEKDQFTNDSKASTTKKLASDELFANDHVMDNFYTDFEDRFRGSEDMILKRLEEYTPYFSDSKVNFEKKPVLDIGSGRGEFLQLLKNNKIKAVGLDINHDMVERSNNKSLQAVQGDALTYLLATKPQTYGAITGFHIVEHIPFNTLMRIFKSAHRALTSGGFVIFETPNPENIIVATSGFYTDPSHLNPIPPDLLAFSLETCGFKNVQIKRLHPVEVGPKETAGLPEEVSGRFYGPRDYAVIGYK